MNQSRSLLVLFTAALVAWVAPLLGAWSAGRPLDKFLRFPPHPDYMVHAGFAWDAFALFSVPAIGAIAAFAWALVRARPARRVSKLRAFPAWGWLGLALIALGWVLAWSKGMPPAWRQESFTLLWTGYVLAANGWALRRAGRSPLTHATGAFLALFPASALFWWLFEHLNQFAGNWYYSDVGTHGAADYFLHASLPFSTVLPAVASTWAWLRSFPRIDALALAPIPIADRGGRVLAWLALLGGAAALFLLPRWPDALFSMLWLAPLLVLAGLEYLMLGESLLAPLARGDWRRVLQPALAALVCGLLWELWNWGSFAKWHYSIPFVQRFRVFEMPLLGYAGYLPFGVECALVIGLVARFFGRRLEELA